jgi:hypothetical protein
MYAVFIETALISPLDRGAILPEEEAGCKQLRVD